MGRYILGPDTTHMVVSRRMHALLRKLADEWHLTVVETHNKTLELGLKELEKGTPLIVRERKPPWITK